MFTLRLILQHYAFNRDVIGIIFAELSRLDVWMCTRACLRSTLAPPKHMIACMNVAQLTYIEPYVEGFSSSSADGARMRKDDDALHFLLNRCRGFSRHRWCVVTGCNTQCYRSFEPRGRLVSLTKQKQRDEMRMVMPIISAWPVRDILSACRFMDASWYKMLSGGCSRKYVAAALLYGNIELLDEMLRRGDIKERNDKWMLSQMRHARTWRWLCSIYVSGDIVLKLDPKPSLIVALHRARQPYKLATKSRWVESLIATLPPV